jgi:hypothetical protein
MARHPRIKIVAIDIAGKRAIAACRTVTTGSFVLSHFGLREDHMENQNGNDPDEE